MKREIGVEAMRGFVSGVLATAAMSGVNTALRRVQDPGGGGALPSPAHYEKIGERLVQLVSGNDQALDDEARIRLGEALHFLFGGIMGTAFAFGTERVLPLPAGFRGSAHGLALWAVAFAGYFPLLRAHPGVWTWSRPELVATLRGHLVYGNCVMLLTRGWRAMVRAS